MVQMVSDAGWATGAHTPSPGLSRLSVWLLAERCFADEHSSIRGQWTVVTPSRAPPRPRPRAVHGMSLAFIPTGPSGFAFFFTNEGTRTIVAVFPATGWQSQDHTSPSVQSPHCLCPDAGRGPELQAPAGVVCPWWPAVCSRSVQTWVSCL